MVQEEQTPKIKISRDDTSSDVFLIVRIHILIQSVVNCKWP